MKKHKWWHFLFVTSSYQHRRDTSYDGNILFSEFEIETNNCLLCGHSKSKVKDLKEYKVHVFGWADEMSVSKDVRKVTGHY